MKKYHMSMQKIPMQKRYKSIQNRSNHMGKDRTKVAQGVAEHAQPRKKSQYKKAAHTHNTKDGHQTNESRSHVIHPQVGATQKGKHPFRVAS